MKQTRIVAQRMRFTRRNCERGIVIVQHRKSELILTQLKGILIIN